MPRPLKKLAYVLSQGSLLSQEKAVQMAARCVNAKQSADSSAVWQAHVYDAQSQELLAVFSESARVEYGLSSSAYEVIASGEPPEGDLVLLPDALPRGTAIEQTREQIAGLIGALEFVSDPEHLEALETRIDSLSALALAAERAENAELVSDSELLPIPSAGVQYATEEGFIHRFGVGEWASLTDSSGDGMPENERIQAAFEDTRTIINQALGQRYPLPLEGMPLGLEAHAHAILRRVLYRHDAPESVRQAHEAALAWLRRVSSGLEGLLYPSGKGFKERDQATNSGTAANVRSMIFSREGIRRRFNDW